MLNGGYIQTLKSNISSQGLTFFSLFLGNSQVQSLYQNSCMHFVRNSSSNHPVDPKDSKFIFSQEAFLKCHQEYYQRLYSKLSKNKQIKQKNAFCRNSYNLRNLLTLLVIQHIVLSQTSRRNTEEILINHSFTDHFKFAMFLISQPQARAFFVFLFGISN